MESRRWGTWLPNERELCKQLQISRNTLRAALVQLKSERRIKPVHGVGSKIVTRSRMRQRRAVPADVALLTPIPIERLRPLQNFWIDELRALLSERGVRLRVFQEPKCFGPKPEPMLEALTTGNPHGCWILMLATKAVQSWFSDSRIPCIVAGSTYRGINLPSRDLNYRAICRHAAGVLIGLGHRRIVMLAEMQGWAGRLDSEEGLMEAAKQSGQNDVVTSVVYAEPSAANFTQVLQRILKLTPAVSGILILHPYAFITVATRLAERGIRVPQQISIICRDDDPALAFFIPVPARYVVNPHMMAKSLLKPVLQLLEGEVVSQLAVRIVPEFVRGETIGPLLSV